MYSFRSRKIVTLSMPRASRRPVRWREARLGVLETRFQVAEKFLPARVGFDELERRLAVRGVFRMDQDRQSRGDPLRRDDDDQPSQLGPQRGRLARELPEERVR
jgi:hypothetical protein